MNLQTKKNPAFAELGFSKSVLLEGENKTQDNIIRPMAKAPFNMEGVL